MASGIQTLRWRRYGISAVSLLLLFLSGLSVPAQRGPRPNGGNKVLDRTFEYGPGVTIRVDNPTGTTSIEVWGEEFTHISAGRDTEDQTTLPSEVAYSPSRTQLTVRCLPRPGTSPISLKIFLPRASHLRFASESGNVEIVGPVASATAETDSGNIVFEAPRSLNADLNLHSDSGQVGSVTLASYSERSANTIKGRLGSGGGSIILRTGSGDITLKPLRNSVVVMADRRANQTAPARPTGSDDRAPASIFPEPDTRPGDRPMTDIFGGGQRTDDASSSRGNDSRQQRNSTDDSTMSGGVGVRIIPPPGNPTLRRDGRSGPPSDTPTRPDANPGSGSQGGSQTAAADEVLNNLPPRDPATTPPAASGRPKLRRNSGAPAGTDPEASDPDAITVDSKLVNLNAVVTTADGRAITNLSAGDFEVYEDDVKQEVAHFAPATTPFNLVLLLDLSGSTREKIDSIRRSALQFVEATNGQDRVSIVTFTRAVNVLCRPTSDRSVLRNRIMDMRATDGGTAFYEAVWFTLADVLGPFANERNAVVVMTDGVDNSISAAYPAPSRVSFRQMVDRILESGTLVYPIYLDTEQENYEFHWGETSDVYSLARIRLQQMADASGGVLHLARAIDDLTGVYQKIIAELRTVYSLGYYPASTARDGKWHRIRVRATRSESVIRTRRGYYAK